MKKLERSDMKKLMGGQVAPPDLGGLECATVCTKYINPNYTQVGECSKQTNWPSQPQRWWCECSIAGGTSCTNV